MLQTVMQGLNTGFALVKSWLAYIEPNKVAGAFVLFLLSIWVIDMIGDVLVKPRPRTAPVVAAAGTDTKTPAPKEAPTLEPVGPLLAAADPAKGQRTFKKCAACHTSKKGGAKKIGPNLWNIVNAKQGRSDDFSYSKAMRGMGKTWSYEALNGFLAKPKAYLPGTKMAFAGVKKVSDRANLIAYLRSLSESPAALP